MKGMKTDVKVAFGFFGLSLLLVIGPIAWALIFPNPLYITPFERGEYIRLMKDAGKGDEKATPAELDTPVKEIFDMLIDKYTVKADFLRVLRAISNDTILFFRNNIEMNMRVDKYPIVSACIRIIVSHQLGKDYDIDKIDEYVRKNCDLDDCITNFTTGQLVFPVPFTFEKGYKIKNK